MRILIITEYYREVCANGSEVFARLLIDELQNRHQVSVMAHATDDALPGLSFGVPGDVYRSIDQLKNFLYEHISPEAYDLVYNLGGLHFGCFIVKYLRELYPGLTVVNHFQILYAPYGAIESMSKAKIALLSKPQAEAASGAALNIFISADELNNAHRHGFHLSGSSVAVINNGIEINKDETEQAHGQIDIPLINGTKPVVFLAAGRFSDHSKGADMMFRAFRRLVHDRKDVYLVAVGPVEKYQFLLNDVPAENYLLLSWLARKELLNLFSLADIMLVPSRYEPFGLIAAEAMLAGLPVIANDTGGLSEMVYHHTTGLLNPLRNGWLGFYKCMAELAQMPEARQSMAQAAKAAAIKQFDIKDIARKVDQHLQRALLSHKTLEWKPALNEPA